MRRIDAEPIQSAYDEWKSGRKKMARDHQQLEETRVKALNDYNKLKRMAKLAREGGNTGHFATMMTGIAGAAGTYTNLGGDFTEFQTQETGGGIETSTLPKNYKPGGK